MPQRPAPQITCFVNGVADPTLQPIACQRSAGGDRLDYMILQRDLAAANMRVVNLSLAQGVDTQIEIVGSVPNVGNVTYGWGKLSRQKCVVAEGQERIEYVARIEPFHFGDPLWGTLIYNTAPARYQQIDLPIVFNPIIDGRTEGNMREGDIHPNILCNVFQHPESVRTDKAQEEQEANAVMWTISAAVRYLCQMANRWMQYIENPTPLEIDATFDDSRDIVRNVAIPDGTYLPQALDLLIKPLGYMWYIDYRAIGRRTIRFFKRSTVTQLVAAGMQPPGQYYNRMLTDTCAFDVEFDISEMANQVLGLGGFCEIESTWELKRAWSDDDDSKSDSPDDLLRTADEFDTVSDVWRKWVLNEAGDYTGLRNDITDAHDFSDLADQYTGENFAPPRRRRFMPMLTLGDDKTPLGKVDGVSVQYWDYNAAKWIDVISECQVLTRECGVFFTGKHPPEEIMRQGDEAKVRVTATIRFDTRLKYLAAKHADSPNADPISVVLDLSDRFQYRRIHRPSGVEFDSDSDLTVNDATKLAYYCEQIREAWDMAAFSGPVQLEGIDNADYTLGQSMLGIVGREISFNGKANGAMSQTYPHIVGMTFDFQRHRTTLMLDQFRKDKMIDRLSREDTAENKSRKFNRRTQE